MAQIAITIDTEFPDHPARDPIATCGELLEILRRDRVPATFFIVGSWARAYPGLVETIAAAGHLIGAHGYSHCSLEKMNDAGIIDDLTECHDYVLDAGSETKPWFRAPYGAVDAPNRRVPDAIATAGYRHIPWDAGGCDWDPELSADDIAARTLAEIDAHGGPCSIVLFHSWPDRTPQALNLVLQGLSSARPDYVTVDRLR
jgi:peptidoglycan-N-acetylglucosamine deacetylase